MKNMRLFKLALCLLVVACSTTPPPPAPKSDTARSLRVESTFAWGCGKRMIPWLNKPESYGMLDQHYKLSEPRCL